MRSLLLTAALLAAIGCQRRPSREGTARLPGEVWLYAWPPEGRWSAEVEEEDVVTLPSAARLQLRTSQPLQTFRVRLVDADGRELPARVKSDLLPTGDQMHTLDFEGPIPAGAWRLVIDPPIGRTLRDAAGRRYRAQRFRLRVVQREGSKSSAASLARSAATSRRSLR